MFSKGDILAIAKCCFLANFAFLRLQIEKPGCGFSGKNISFEHVQNFLGNLFAFAEYH
jgi:hypothetical protein